MTSTGIPLGLNWASAAVGNWTGLRLPDPFPTFNFAVEIEGLLVGGFTEVSGLESQIEMQSYREGGVNGFAHQLPGAASPSNLVLKHGLTAISTLWNWYDNTARGVIQRKSGTIALLDRRQIPVMWWNFRNALPVRWTGPTFTAGSDEVGVESLELVHEGLTKPLLGQALALGHGIADMAR
ncbi:phage tail protein [Streptomyces sp. 11x1]|uniref:phage tail protein n=1 Tax=Streptomyces sp. 11x1 TaxID=3038642 RepID=UPI00292E3C98|nr:phage tail protein [Streptomyces sp. 11x1]WNZ08068.1 phage tail protein [Streptomyces sp. 11x1]